MLLALTQQRKNKALQTTWQTQKRKPQCVWSMNWPDIIRYNDLARAVDWASFFDTIQYNTFSCDIQYIGWTICLNIFCEKDKKKSENSLGTPVFNIVICMGHLADLVTNLLRHWWWTVIFVFNWMMQLVRTHITFGSIVLFLKICSLEAIFEFWTSSPTIKSTIFKPDVIFAYRQNNVSYIA